MKPIIECKNLTKTFGQKAALKNINLNIERGRIVGLLGPNASGKTTFIKLCNELLTHRRRNPDRGKQARHRNEKDRILSSGKNLSE